MEYKSYKLLQEFGQDLIHQGFDELPLAYIEGNVAPFREIFNSWSSKLESVLVSDLKQALDERLEIKVQDQSFVPIDNHAQGATYVYVTVECEKDQVVFQLRVRYVVFYDKILVLLNCDHTVLNEIRDKKLRKKLRKLVDKPQKAFEQFIELNQL